MKLLKVIVSHPACNVELKGSEGYTTFGPSKSSVQHSNRMIELYEILKKRPDFIPLLQRRSLGFKEFQEAIMKRVQE